MAAKALLRQPMLVGVAVVCLALGIGAASAVFSLVEGILLRDLPFPEPDRLGVIWNQMPALDLLRQPSSALELLDYRDRTEAFEAIGAVRSSYENLTGHDRPERLLAARATSSLFAVLDVGAELGRTFTPEEDHAGADRVAVLSHGLWRRLFAADPDVVGRTLLLNGVPHTIVGVMPAGFHLDLAETYDLWLPLALDLDQLPPRAFRALTVVGRLAEGVPKEGAQAQLDNLARRLGEEHPDVYPAGSGFTLRFVPLSEVVVGDVNRVLLVVSVLVALVLLVACTNAANLLLARSIVRQPELALRVALGARRQDLIGRMLAESVLAAAAAGLLGLALAYAGVRLLVALNPEALPRLDEVGIDGGVLAFTLGVSLLVGLAVGLLPALRSSRPDLQATFKEANETKTTAGARGMRLRGALVVAEVAVATLVLVGAGLMIRSFQELRRVDPGFDARGVLTFHVFLSPNKYPERHLYTGFYHDLLRRVRALPGVTAAGAVNELPLGSRRFAVETELEGYQRAPGEPQPLVDWRPASPGYFETLRIPILSGRGFDARDDADGPPVAVVDRALARRFWPGQDPVGKQLKLVGRPGNVAVWRRVVGMVGEVKALGLEQPPQGHVYTPYDQATFPFFAVVVRTQGDPARLAGDVRRAVWSVDREQPVESVLTMEEIVAASLASQASLAYLVGIFGGVALILVASGVYAVVAYSVAQRTREIGIRLALGARRAGVVRMVVGQSVALTGLGVAMGFLAALASSHAASGVLYEVSARDPLTFAATALVLLGIAVVAAYQPARRALRVDPVEALRRL
jgi:putative ABC transport system permease protein